MGLYRILNYGTAYMQYICNIAAIELQYPGAAYTQQVPIILPEKTQMKTQRIVSLDLPLGS